MVTLRTGRMPVEFGVVCLTALLLCGCGEDSRGGAAGDSAEMSPPDVPAETPPVAAISDLTAPEDVPPPGHAGPDPTSTEGMLLEITRLVAAANAEAERQAEILNQELPGDAEIDRDGMQAYRQQLAQIVELATNVIAATHLDPDQQQAFNNAVHYLSDARLELASGGDTGQAQLLMEDAESLYERDADSFAASEAAFKVVELARRMAQAMGSEDADWLKEYATQAQIFADRFPQEENRAPMGLFQAGRLCDRFGEVDAARQCLEALREQFGQSIFSEQSAGILRRLSVEGQPLELAAESLDGGFIDIGQYRERVVLLAFWSSSSPSFQQDVLILRQLEQEFGDSGLSIIGVSLDADERQINQFLDQHELSWPQVFSSDPHSRGGRNSVARYYGIQVIPSYWLIDANGIVANVTNRGKDLSGLVGTFMKESKTEVH